MGTLNPIGVNQGETEATHVASGAPASCLGIVHIPKTAGTSVRIALSSIEGCYSGPLYFDPSNFGSEAMLDRIPEPTRATVATADDLRQLVAHHRLLMGHFAAPWLVDAGCATLATQVREPRALLLSVYRFWQSSPPEERAGWGGWGNDVVAASDLPIREFLRSKPVQAVVSNTITEKLLGVPTRTGGLFRRASAGLRRRQLPLSVLAERLRIVEWSDNPDRFVARVCEAVGAPDVPHVDHHNVTRVVGEPQKLSPGILRELSRLTSLDNQLLDALTERGLLSRRDERRREQDFAAAAEHLGFSF